MSSREIKFRGERIDNGEFVYGDLIHGVGWKKDKMYILPAVHNLASLAGCDPLDGYNIKPETVGQLTGLYDKNNSPIYEGDILATENSNPEYDLWDKEENGYTEVYWNAAYDCWSGSEWTWDKNKNNESVYDLSFISIIGNIYSNPELIK